MDGVGDAVSVRKSTGVDIGNDWWSVGVRAGEGENCGRIVGVIENGTNSEVTLLPHPANSTDKSTNSMKHCGKEALELPGITPFPRQTVDGAMNSYFSSAIRLSALTKRSRSSCRGLPHHCTLSLGQLGHSCDSGIG